MDKEQKNRLEQELKFLEESLEADVISKDEYERGKERIEKKITELELETPIEEPPVESQKSEEIEIDSQSELSPEQEAEKPIEESIESQKSEETDPQSELPSEQEAEEFKEESSKIKETQESEISEGETKSQSEPKEDIEIKEIKPQPTKIIGAERKIIEEKPNEEEKEKENKLETISTSQFDEESKSSKKWIYGILILILAAILFFSLRGCTSEIEPIEEVIPECLSDSDCKQEGTIGTCSNPDTAEAECQFKQDASTNLIVINDQDCELCDSSRIKSTIKKIFPNVKIQNFDYGAEEAKQLITELNIDALPAYIFDSDVSKAINFDDFKRALVKKGDNYVITNTASGANYYFKREEIENRFDSFLTADISEKTNSNLNEFLGLFENSIDFEKHIVSEKDKTKLKGELGITSYPAFLINNQVKFGGVQSSDSIKDKFCKLNEISGCEKELRKNII